MLFLAGVRSRCAKRFMHARPGPPLLRHISVSSSLFEPRCFDKAESKTFAGSLVCALWVRCVLLVLGALALCETFAPMCTTSQDASNIEQVLPMKDAVPAEQAPEGEIPAKRRRAKKAGE
jgi:hypothetical protein